MTAAVVAGCLCSSCVYKWSSKGHTGKWLREMQCSSSLAPDTESSTQGKPGPLKDFISFYVRDWCCWCVLFDCGAPQMGDQGQSHLLTTRCSPPPVSNSLQAMPRPHPSTPRSTETSSSPPRCRRPYCSATLPATRCPPRTARPKWCTSPWASCPDLKPRASTISHSTGGQPATLLQPWPSSRTQVQWPHLSFW